MKQIVLKNKNNEKVLPDFITDDLSSNSHVKVPSIYGVNEVRQQDITTDSGPVKCGYKIDNKDVYVKRINLGNLANSSSITVPHELDITNITVEKLEGIMRYANIYVPLPNASGDLTSNDGVYISGENIIVHSATDRSYFTAHVYIYFTYN